MDLSAAGPWPWPNDSAVNVLGQSASFSGLNDWTAESGSLPGESRRMMGLWQSASANEAFKSNGGT